MTSLSLPSVNWRLAGAVAACAVALPAMVLLAIEGQVRIPLAAAVAFPLLALAAINIRLAIVAALVFLILLGDLRRALIPIAGWSGMDPLLLVGPAFAVIICGAAMGNGELKLDTPLAKWAAVLTGWMALQIFNPLQGGLPVGVAGVIFLMAPLFWFWVGRAYGTTELMRRVMFGVVLPLGLAATAFGFYQRFVGYLPYQMNWFWIAGYGGLGSPELGLAPISFFASGTEHGAFVVTTGIILWAVFLRGNRAAILLIPPILVGVILTGSRGPVVKVLAMMAVMWAVLGENRAAWVPRFALATVLLGAGLVWSLGAATTVTTDAQVLNNLNRQSRFFAPPEDADESDHNPLMVHGSLLAYGYQELLHRPLGSGLGATSAAATKFGGSSWSTETDLGDVMIATGIPGAIAYHAMIFFIALTSIRYWRRTRSTLALTIIGLLGAHFLLWLGGGLYAVSAIVWFTIGVLDRLHRDLPPAVGAMPPPPVPVS